MDMRVADDLGASVRCAVTAVTVQGDGGARSINPVAARVLREALETAAGDPPGIGAVKVGLLPDRAAVETLSRFLAALGEEGIPVVVDPVLRSTPGSALASDDVPALYARYILPWTTLFTPNREEFGAVAALLTGGDADEKTLAEGLTGSGARAVLVTGGDSGRERCVDVLYGPAGAREVFDHPRIGEEAPRGTGCALSTALAVHLGRGETIAEAVGAAIGYVTGLIRKASTVGNQLLLFPGKQT